MNEAGLFLVDALDVGVLDGVVAYNVALVYKHGDKERGTRLERYLLGAALRGVALNCRRSFGYFKVELDRELDADYLLVEHQGFYDRVLLEELGGSAYELV